MLLSWRLKKNIDYLLPVAGALAIAFFTFKKGKDTRFVVAAGIITLVLLYIITSQVTRNFYLAAPPPVPTGGDCKNYDPRSIIEAIHTDIEELFGTRDIAAYNDLMGLTDCQFITAYNHWNASFFADDKLTLRMAIMNESGSTFSPGTFTQLQGLLDARFKRLGLN